MYYKDQELDTLAEYGNVAQFISFGPGDDPIQRFSRIRNLEADHSFDCLESAISFLLTSSQDLSLNIRCFRPSQMKGGDFAYGLRSHLDICNRVRELCRAGWFVIANETIDVDDGGVSGVVFGEAIEFAPNDTPRCVEKPGTCRLPRKHGLNLLRRVYGFEPSLSSTADERVEFSIHPKRCGYRKEHTIIWERETFEVAAPPPRAGWPNRFSRFLGDKVFGLLVADTYGFRVPRTTIVPRGTAPFSFGQTTGTGETWLRTAPHVQEPGRFTTTFGWRDPFKTVEDDEREAQAEHAGDFQIAAILAQESVDAVFSGAAAATGTGAIVEGVKGTGVRFMLGETSPVVLPQAIDDMVRSTIYDLQAALGPIRMEWAYDLKDVWIIQLHVGGISSDPDVIVQGDADIWVDFDVARGLAELRQEIPALLRARAGVRLLGDIGVTSHLGDLLRISKIPSFILR